MFNTMKRWWHVESESEGPVPDLSLAVTKLMVGMMGVDGKIDQEERDEIIILLEKYYDMSAQDSSEMIEDCLNGEAVNLRLEEVVKYINEHYSIEKRTQIIEQIWRVAHADGEIDFIEDRYLNRISSLLAIPVNTLSNLKKAS
ncbi:MAG: TerB family tellurite resistance protein [Mariprofundaceae bacterium]